MFSKNRIGNILNFSTVLMGFAALIWLFYEFYRLLAQPDFIGSYPVHPGAIDLKMLHSRVHQWAMGKSAFGSVYPPASYMMLWPLLGWMDVTPAIWFWAATSIVALAWLIILLLKESGAGAGRERLFVVLIPLSMYATGAAIGNGQLILHLLPFLIAGILMVDKEGTHLIHDLGAAFLFLISLVKPTVSAPFFWLIMFRPGRLRPGVLIVAGYLIMTVIAAWRPWSPVHFQVPGSDGIELGRTSSIITPISSFLTTGISASTLAGESNIAIWMAQAGLQKYVFPVTLLLLFLIGLWIFLYRKTDIWILLGVTAIFTRFWTYHRWYDDLLILLPMIGLFRMAKSTFLPNAQKVTAGALLGLTLVLMIAPGGLYLFPKPLNMFWANLQSIVWAAMMIFLMTRARRFGGPVPRGQFVTKPPYAGNTK